uniref:Isoleucyl-tRNA synthetase 2, mitochondrial n=1 Tax=Oncorhynchus tshawytscha TaxID=74940 RepID=A0AAZ3SRQ6_ONCTS
MSAPLNAPFSLQPPFISGSDCLFLCCHFQGLINRDYTPVFWPPSSPTALSEAELEYNPQHVSKAIYTTFALVNLPPKMAEAEGELGNISVLVWTTQPWTIPANQAICHCQQTTSRLHSAFRAWQLPGTELESVGTFTGAELEGRVCQHSTISGKEVPLLPANLLTMGKGTGLVHTAPAHGMENYSVVSQFELTVECMADEEGRFNELAGPELQNLSVMGEGNDTVISMLKAVGALVKEEECVHSYPDDRGSKQPVDRLVKMRVMPESARGSLFAQLDRRPSWCISHQRSWGMPIPVFYHIETGEPLMNNDCWWELPLESLLPPEELKKVNHCSVTDYERGENVLDIWFDSGTSWAAVFEGVSYPGKATNFSLRALVVHDFVVSEKGEKVLGNLVDPDSAIHVGKDPSVSPAYEVDVLLWWVAKSNVFSEVQIGSTVLNSARDNIDKVSISWCLLWTFNFRQHYRLHLSGHGQMPFGHLFLVLSGSNTTTNTLSLMNSLIQLLFPLPGCTVNLRTCQMVLEAILDAVTRSIAPIVCHLVEVVYLHTPGHDGTALCVQQSCVEEACAIRDSFLSSIPGRSAAEYELTIEIEPGLLFELIQERGQNSLQDEPNSYYAQLTELMVSSWTTLNSALPRDMPLSPLVTFLSSVQSDGVTREDSAYQIAAVPTSMVRCPRFHRYTSVSPDCP